MSPKDKDGHEIKVQLGQGVFGQCEEVLQGHSSGCQIINHLSSSQDVWNEVATMAMIACINTLFVWCKFYSKAVGFFLVSYFYGLDNSPCTLHRALHIVNHCVSQGPLQERSHCNSVKLWNIYKSKRPLRRDIEGDNINVTAINNTYHTMLIDFGKAIWLSDAP